MSGRIHRDEPDTSETVLRAILHDECPQWAASPAEYLETSGTSNAMWRIHTDESPDVVVRLPRRPEAADSVLHEASVLRQIERAQIGKGLITPRVRHLGRPHPSFPYHWTVLEWIDGTDLWLAGNTFDRGALTRLGTDLADAVRWIGSAKVDGARQRLPGARGGPLGPLLERLDWWLTEPTWHAADFIDTRAVRRLASEACEVEAEPVVHGFVHGDLIPGNLLVKGAQLISIIDWGGAGWGDTAEDLSPAWAVFDTSERQTFKDAVGATEAAWIRGRTFALEQAVGGVLYYTPKRHPLGEVMASTLARILDSPMT